jgi:transglutaminase-like putative cysteine protease
MQPSAPLLSVMRKIARPMSRPISRDKADTLLLLFTCLLVLTPHAGHLPPWAIATALSLLLWRGWITFHGMRMPSRWLLAPLAVLVMCGVYATYRTVFGREAGVAMLALLLALKLLEMHAKRDLFVVVFLCFFLVLTSFFYSQGIGTALMTLAAVVAILTTQLSFQYVDTVPPLGQRLRLGAFILGLAAPLTLVLFLLFPRIQGPLWGLPSDARSGRTGMSETMAPGNISKLALSDEIAFRAKFLDEPPSQSSLYWRGGVLGAYDGRNWLPLQVSGMESREIIVRPRGRPIRYQVTLEATGQRWLYALEAPQALPRVAGYRASIEPELQLRVAQPINERIRYDAASYVDFDLQPNEHSHVLQQWLQLPPGFNPRALEFAQRLRRQSNDHGEIVNAVLRFFRAENFRYTLEPPTLGKHMVDEFLFDTRAGFCEHYSAAFVVLMRAAGIPARVVIGYQGGEINPTDGYMTVRQSDAHAWTEVWLARRGWVRVDPTAAVSPERVEHNLSSAIPQQFFGGLISFDGSNNSWLAKLRFLRQNWDAMTNAWNQWVLNYTPDRQKNFIRSLGFEKADWRTLITLMFVLASIATAIVVLPLIRNRPKPDPIEALYQSLCRQMAQRGYARSIHEGPRAYGSRLCASESTLPPEKKAAVIRFLEHYESARYGVPDKTPSSVVVSKLKSLLAECR